MDMKRECGDCKHCSRERLKNTGPLQYVCRRGGLHVVQMAGSCEHHRWKAYASRGDGGTHPTEEPD